MPKQIYGVKPGVDAPPNEKARSTYCTAGPKNKDLKHRDFTLSIERGQSDEAASHERLLTQFEKVGLHLYRLGDSALLVTSAGSEFVRHVPDIRTAKALLAQFGGAQ